MMKAPFNPKQIKSLKGYQKCGHCHPFTCGDCGALLSPFEHGWLCPSYGCAYTQDWCHDFMANDSWKINKTVMKEAQQEWRFRKGRYVHDADCYFWDRDICTCGLIHHFMPISDDDIDPEWHLDKWYGEERAKHEIQLNRVLNDFDPVTLPYVPPTEEEVKERMEILRKMFPEADLDEEN